MIPLEERIRSLCLFLGAFVLEVFWTAADPLALDKRDFFIEKKILSVTPGHDLALTETILSHCTALGCHDVPVVRPDVD